VSSVSEKLVKARSRLLTNEPWYGAFTLRMQWVASEMLDSPENCRTMGVTVKRNGGVRLRYNPKALEGMRVTHLMSLIKHEIEHLVRMHPFRGAGKVRMPWFIATDMAVNGPANDIRISVRDHELDADVSVLDVLPGITIPEDWPADETAEYFYEKLMDGGISITLVSMDNHNDWDECDLMPEEARQLIKELVDEATQLSRGEVPGHLAAVIEELRRPRVDLASSLRTFVGRACGGRRTTYSRASRRNHAFGAKGISHRHAAKVLVIADTSGSTSNLVPHFFGVLEHLLYRVRVSMVLWDAGFQGFVPRYRRGDWKKIEWKGLGGTDMAEAYEWARNNTPRVDAVIFLTDGETPWPDIPFAPTMAVVLNDRDSDTQKRHGIVALSNRFDDPPEWCRVLRLTSSDFS